MSAVFFDRLASAAKAASASRRHIAVEQLLTTAGNGVRVQAEKLAQDSVAAVAQFDGFQSSEEAALLFVQQAVKQQNGRFEFIGRDLKSGGIGHQRNGAGGLPGADLIPRLPAIGGGVQESTSHFGSAQTAAKDQNRGGDPAPRRGGHQPTHRRTTRQEPD